MYIDTPIIISASRATDIPAFYAKWFAERLKAGYVMNKNAYKGYITKINLNKARVYVFWTKNAEPLIPYLHLLDEKNIGYYFQYTVNDYDTNIEKHVPSLNKRIDTFKRLSDMIGPERVIWRYDPIITGILSVEEHLNKIENIGNQLKSYTNKLVFSFLDDYGKAKINLIRTGLFNTNNINTAVPNIIQEEELARGIAKLCNAWNMQASTCAENNFFYHYGITPNCCIDPVLIDKLFSAKDPLLNEYMSQFRINDTDVIDYVKAKDKYQRRLCGCMVSKDIGTYNTCLHDCAYCYATQSYEQACYNHKKHNINATSIIPFEV